MSTPTTVFYSWQSDHPNKINRGFIGDALDRAIKRLQRDESIVEAERPDLQRDNDTQGVAGSPDIAATILRKIDECAIFVADVTTIGLTGSRSRATANPNVLFELGYAWRTLGDAKVLLVSNTVFSSDPEHPEQDLPFDLRGKRLISYSLREDEEKATARERLVSVFVGHLRDMLPSLRVLPPRPPIDLRLWLGPHIGPITFQREFSLDWDRDGQPEPIYVLGANDAAGQPRLHVLAFRFLVGGWKLLDVDPIESLGSVFICDVEMRSLTGNRSADLVVGWNCGGSGSWLIILRWEFFSFVVASRRSEGLSGPFGVGSRTWVQKFRQQVTFQSIEGTEQEEVVEYLHFMHEESGDARELVPLITIDATGRRESMWVRRTWRWDEHQRSFLMTRQERCDGPPMA